MTSSDATTTELGAGTFEAMTAVATRRLVRTAILIGMVTVLGSCAIAYLAYQGSRHTVLTRVGEVHRTLARMVRTQLERTLANRFLSSEQLYRSTDELWQGFESGAALLLVKAPGTVIYHSSRPELVGRDLRDVRLRPSLPSAAKSWDELFDHRDDWIGQIRLDGRQLLLSGVYLERLDVYVTVEVEVGRVERELVSSALPWGLGVLVIAGLLAPLALHFLYRGYRVAQQASLAASAVRRQSEIRYRDLYNKTPVMMHSVDGDGRIVKVNNHWLRTLGFRRDEVLGRRPTDFLTPKSRRWAEEVGIPRYYKQGSCHEVPYEFVTRDGRVLQVLLSATLERDKDGHALKSQATLVDVTDLKHAEAEREAVIRQLEEKNKELESFTYTVSHDLKAPLITIKGFLGFLEKDVAAGDEERLRSDLDRIHAAADKMKQLLDELLELSRIGRFVNPPEDAPLGELAREAVELVEGRLAERGFEVNVADDLPVVQVDRVRLVQVFQNLLENSIKFMGDQPEPRIEVSQRYEGGETVFFVRDNGVGIEGKYLKQIFGLFQKMSSGSEGTGIGLALVRRIVEIHGGRVWAESPGPGEGASFCFTLGEPEGSGSKGSGPKGARR